MVRSERSGNTDNDTRAGSLCETELNPTAEFLEMKNAPENASCLPQPDPDHFLCLETGRGSACCYLSCRRGVDTNSFFFLCSVPRVGTHCPQPHSMPALCYTTSCDDLPLRPAGRLSRWAGGTAVEGRG
ncbi:unnamed protein product [Boreogadus saida]